MTRLALLCLACSLEANVPNLSDPCSRVVVAEYTAPAEECIRLDAANSVTLFRRADSEDCGGPSCIRVCGGDTALALEKVAPSEGADWTVRQGAPDSVPFCAHSAICEEEPDRCE